MNSCYGDGLVDNEEGMPTLSTEHDRRLEMLDGLPVIHVDSSVTRGTRMGISVFKTAIMGLFFAASGTGMFKIYQTEPSDKIEVSPLVLKADLCAKDGPHLMSKDTGHESGLQSVLRTSTHKVFRFGAAGDLDIPWVTYYESEEMYAEPPQNTYAYSLTLFGRHALHFTVEVDDLSCLPKGDIDAEDERAQNLFGAACVAELTAAGRRTPRASLPLVPMSHGALLVQQRSHKMWSTSLGKFNKTYHTSSAFTAYWWIVRALRIGGTAVILLAVFSAAFSAWWRQAERWVLQYDFLWQQASLQNNMGNVDWSKVDVKKLASKGSAWELAHMCGVFWTFDHVVGNPIINAERWSFGVASAFVHAGLMTAVAVLPIVHASFFPKWRIFAFTLVIAHFVQCFGFAVAYFFQFALHKRQGFYYGYLATASGLVVYSVGYTVSILLFMVTRLVVMPHEAGGIVGAVAGLAVYAIAMTVGLRHLRHRIVARMMGAESKGQLDAALTKAGLDTRSMMFRTVAGSVSIGLLGIMLVLVGDLYFERHNAGFSQLFSVVCTSCLAVFAFMKQMQSRYVAVRQLEGDIDDY